MQYKDEVTVTACRTFRHPSNYVAIFIDKCRGDKLFVARPIEFEERQPFETDGVPTLSLDQNMAQKLMDDLWTCGVRPSEGTGSAGAMAATQDHLKDMKKIAFKKLNITE